MLTNKIIFISVLFLSVSSLAVGKRITADANGNLGPPVDDNRIEDGETLYELGPKCIKLTNSSTREIRILCDGFYVKVWPGSGSVPTLSNLKQTNPDGSEFLASVETDPNDADKMQIMGVIVRDGLMSDRCAFKSVNYRKYAWYIVPQDLSACYSSLVKYED